MRQTRADRDFALEPRDGTLIVDPVRTDHLDRDLAEQQPIPRAVHLVARAHPKRSDHDECLVDLLAASQIPTRIRIWTAGGDGFVEFDELLCHASRLACTAYAHVSPDRGRGLLW